jgi:hypothetical protein
VENPILFVRNIITLAKNITMKSIVFFLAMPFILIGCASGPSSTIPTIPDSIRLKYQAVDSFATGKGDSHFTYLIYLPDTSNTQLVNHSLSLHYAAVFPSKWLHIYYFNDKKAAEKYVQSLSTGEQTTKGQTANFMRNPSNGLSDFFYIPR